MSAIEPDDLLHNLIDALSAIHGWAHLVANHPDCAETLQSHLQDVQHIAERATSRIQAYLDK